MEEQPNAYYEVYQIPGYKNTAKPQSRPSWWTHRWPSLDAGLFKKDVTSIRGVLKFKTPVFLTEINKRTRYWHKPITEATYHKFILENSKDVWINEDAQNGPWHYNIQPKPQDSEEDEESSEQITKRQKTQEEDQSNSIPLQRRKLVIHIGQTGTGKTQLAQRIYPDAYWKPKGGVWFNYAGQDTVVIDNYTGAGQTAAHIQAIIDDPLYMINTGTKRVPLTAQTIVIISQDLPWIWQLREKKPYCMIPIYRRITEITYHRYGYNPVQFIHWNEFLQWYKEHIYTKLTLKNLIVRPPIKWSNLQSQSDTEQQTDDE